VRNSRKTRFVFRVFGLQAAVGRTTTRGFVCGMGVCRQKGRAPGRNATAADSELRRDSCALHARLPPSAQRQQGGWVVVVVSSSSVVSGSQPIGADVGGRGGGVQLDTLRRSCPCLTAALWRWSSGGIGSNGEIRRTTSRLRPTRGECRKWIGRLPRGGSACQSSVVVVVEREGYGRFSDRQYGSVVRVRACVLACECVMSPEPDTTLPNKT
jgi:hypothetical protein